jgi:hypothetical protein
MASDVEASAAAEAPEGKNWKRKGKHDKEKPWDQDPTIDRWTVDKFDPSWNEGGLLEVSSFSTLFPEYRGRVINHLSSSPIPFPSRLPACLSAIIRSKSGPNANHMLAKKIFLEVLRKYIDDTAFACSECREVSAGRVADRQGRAQGVRGLVRAQSGTVTGDWLLLFGLLERS